MCCRVFGLDCSFRRMGSLLVTSDGNGGILDGATRAFAATMAEAKTATRESVAAKATPAPRPSSARYSLFIVCVCVCVCLPSLSSSLWLTSFPCLARRVCRRPTSARVRFSDEGEGDTVPSPRSISHLEHNLLDGHDILDDAEAAAPATASPARSRVKSLPLLRSYADRVRLAIRCVG